MSLEAFWQGTDGAERESTEADSLREAFLRETQFAARERTSAPMEAPARANAPQATERTLNYRDQTITVRFANGVANYMRDESGEWESTDGEVWKLKGSSNVYWQGDIRFDDDGNLVQRNSSYGVTHTYGKDGSYTTSITAQNGDVRKIVEHQNGTKEYFSDQKWRSTDGGRSWTNESGQTWRGQLRIDNYGAVQRENGGRWEIINRSGELETIGQRMEQLQRNYNVTFGPAGQTRQYDWKNPETDRTESLTVSFRPPDLPELETLERTLQKFAHLSSRQDRIDLGGMRFSWLAATGDGKKVGLWGWYESSRNGLPQIFFGPRNHAAADGWEALEGTAVHEIAHHLQKRRWPDGGSTVPQELRDFFGWRLQADGNFQLRDRAGNYWQNDDIRVRRPDGSWGYESRWYPVIGGRVVKEDGRARTTRQMFDSLPEDRRPCTTYFTHPQEAHAEAIAMLLHDPRMLMQRNADLYAASRRWDQADINARFGTDRAGQPNRIRAGDGRIVENNEANRRELREAEQRWRAQPRSSNSRIDWSEAVARNPGCPCCSG